MSRIQLISSVHHTLRLQPVQPIELSTYQRPDKELWMVKVT